MGQSYHNSPITIKNLLKLKLYNIICIFIIKGLFSQYILVYKTFWLTPKIWNQIQSPMLQMLRKSEVISRLIGNFLFLLILVVFLLSYELIIIHIVTTINIFFNILKFFSQSLILIHQNLVINLVFSYQFRHPH